MGSGNHRERRRKVVSLVAVLSESVPQFREIVTRAIFLLWVNKRPTPPPSCESEAGGTADEIRAKTDFGAQMSVAGGGAEELVGCCELRLIAISRLTSLRNNIRNLAHRDVGGGRSRPQHQERS